MRKKIILLTAILTVLSTSQINLFAQDSAGKSDNLTSTNRPMRILHPLTLTVGQNEGHLQGNDDKVIQAGIDYLHRLGGGVLHILPGTYTMNNAIYIRPNITIRGSGNNTILKKAAGYSTPLVREADWFEYGVQVKDPSGFKPGQGIMVRTTEKALWMIKVLKGTVTEIAGDVVFFDKITGENFYLEKESVATNIFPLFTAEYVDNITIEDIVLDGNRTENELINGNFSGAVFLEHCNNWSFRNVTAQNYNGDGFSWQVCNDFRFENCKSMNNGGLGFHPGSGSQRPVFKDCAAKGNDQGFYFCWSVTGGSVDNCIFSDNVKYGISIGHRDTDNVIRNCTIEGNKHVGILFRKGGDSEFFGGHRNLIDNCIIRDNGADKDGVGIDITNETNDITIKNCTFGNTSGKIQKIGIQIGKKAKRISFEDNTFSDVPVKVKDLRK
ncbi:right-handed parallel beta-helix repeat-containing protein [candidate division KSB1 bacterium]